MSMDKHPCLSGHEFTSWVAENVRRGLRIVPFVGSGMSAPSGILTSQLFVETLTWAVYRSVAGPEDGNPERLNVREGWPSPPQGTQISDAREWVSKRFKKACAECGLDVDIPGGFVKSIYPKAKSLHSPLDLALRRPLVPGILWRPLVTAVDDSAVREMLQLLERQQQLADYPARPDVSPTSLAYIEECAVRSLHDWRSALRFLARLRHCPDEEGGRLELGEVDLAVIDSFNSYVVGGRRHNFAHTMLGHLAQRARIRVILTTNFDTLIEEAFAELHEPLRAISVHLRDPLPHPDAVHARNCVVKLHGESIETRADFSLDYAPSLEDKRRFFHYVQGYWPEGRRHGRRAEGHVNANFVSGLLLVCGYSGSDMRCMQMVKYLLDTERRAKVLWICHSQRDLENLYQLFHEQGYTIAPDRHALDTEGEEPHAPRARIVATVTDRTDLVLYELYQRLTLSLPSGGASFQFMHTVPPGTSFTQSPRAPEAPESFADTLASALIASTIETNGRVVVADGCSGLSGPLRQAFHRLTRQERKQGIWLELEDYADVRAVAHEILAVIAYRCGEFQREHAHLMPPLDALRIEARAADHKKKQVAAVWAAHIATLLAKWRLDPADWVIAIYGRNGPGGCAAWGPSLKGATAWDEADYIELDCLLRALRDVRRPPALGEASKREDPAQRPGGFAVLYAPYSILRQMRDFRKQEFLDRTFPWELKRCPAGTSAEVFRAFKEYEEQRGERGRHAPHRVQVQGDAFRANLYRVEYLPHEPSPSFEENMFYVMQNWVESLRSQAVGTTDDPSVRRRQVRRLQFLFSSVLFRQSRHFSALLSQGVYPCPHRYNLSGLDNDLYRYKNVFEWLDELNRLGHTFFRKPGGFAWMYRDTRFGIQHLIQTRFGLPLASGDVPHASAAEVSDSAAEAEEKGGRAQEESADYAGGHRAKTHFWIAEWHLRAFRATGHALPLLEACYHLASCIRYARFATRRDLAMMEPGAELADELRRYRQRLIRLAMFEITKALRMGRNRIRFWLQNSAGEPWFGLSAEANEPPRKPGQRDRRGGGTRIVEELRELAANQFATPEGAEQTPDVEYERWLRWIEEEFRHLPQNRRGGALDMLGARDHLRATETPGYNFELSDACVYGKEASWQEELDSVLRRLPTTDGGELTQSDWKGLAQCFPPLHGTSGKASRNGRGADRAGTTEVKKHLQRALKRWQAEFLRKAAGNGPVIHFAVQGLFELAYQIVRRAKAIEHATEYSARYCPEEECGSSDAIAEFGSEVRSRIRLLWVHVCSLCWLGLDLCGELPPALWELDFHERSRLSTLYGLALGRLHRFYEAHRRLNEAAALRAHPEELRSRQALGIVALRRAEVYLIEANRLRELLAFATLMQPLGGELRTVVSSFSEWLYLERLLAEGELVRDDLTDKGKLKRRLGVARGSQFEEFARQCGEIYFGSVDELFEQPGRDGKSIAPAWEKALRRLHRLHYARLDDAWTVLEVAAEHLRESHVAIWASRLNALRLLVFALHYPHEVALPSGKRLVVPKSLAFRRQEDHVMTLNAIFRAGLAESDHRRLAMVRLLDYAWRAAENLIKIDPQRYGPRAEALKRDIGARVTAFAAAERTRSRKSKRDDSLLDWYLDRVLARVPAEKKEGAAAKRTTPPRSRV